MVGVQFRSRLINERVDTMPDRQKGLIRKHVLDKWQTTWETYQRAHERDPPVAQAVALQKNQKLYLLGSSDTI